MLTEYQPQPGKTDSEYNDLKAAYVARGLNIDALLDRLNDKQTALDEATATASQLRVENAELRAQLNNLIAYFATSTNKALRLTTESQAADDPYEATADEDSVEYQFPESPKTIDS